MPGDGMRQIREISERRRGNGFNALETLRLEHDVVRCYTCNKEHVLKETNPDQVYLDFAFRHRSDNGCVVTRMSPDYYRKVVDKEQRWREENHLSVREFTHNASVLEAFQGSDQSLTITALNSLASSATVGWGSGSIDNSTNLYLDYLWALALAAVNTAPSSDKAFYPFGATALNTTDLPTTGASSSGVLATTQAALTFPSISTLGTQLQQFDAIPYSVQNAPLQTGLCSTAYLFKGNIGLYLWYAMLNFSNMTIAASGNAWKYRGIYNTVS